MKKSPLERGKRFALFLYTQLNIDPCWRINLVGDFMIIELLKVLIPLPR
jgi:hypothetical protein